MTARPVAAACFLAFAALAHATAPASPGASAIHTVAAASTGERAAAPGIKPPPRMYGSVLDTGQFLPDSAVLARVNDRVIRVGEFIERFFNSYAEFRPAPDSAGRVLFLNNMVKKEILANVARQAGRPENFEDRLLMRQHTMRVLSNVLFQRSVLDSVVEPTEEELQRTHARLGYELRLGKIVFPTNDVAERVRRDLVARQITWAEATTRYGARPPADTLARGDLGWTAFRTLQPTIAPTVFDLKPDEMSGVLRDEDGYAIYRVAARRDIPLIDYWGMRALHRIDFRNMQILALSERMTDQAAAQIGLVHDAAAIAWAASAFSAPLSGAGMGQHPVIRIDARAPVFAPEDTSRVLARWNGGQFTLGGFMAAYSVLPALTRPNVSTAEAFRHQTDLFILEPYFAELARARGLETDSLAVFMIDKRREELMVEHLFEDSVMSQVVVAPAERRRYYKTHLADFVTYPRVTYALFHCAGRSEAESLATRLRAGESAEAIIRGDSLAGIHRGAMAERRGDEKGTEYYQLLFDQLKPGQLRIRGPRTPGPNIVLQLVTRAPARQLSFDESLSILDDVLRNQAADKRLESLIARHRKHMRIVTHPELVMHVRLTDEFLN